MTIDRARRAALVALAATASAAVAPATAQDAPLSMQHDGTWTVDLVCSDVRTKSELVRGGESECARAAFASSP